MHKCKLDDLRGEITATVHVDEDGAPCGEVNREWADCCPFWCDKCDAQFDDWAEAAHHIASVTPALVLTR